MEGASQACIYDGPGMFVTLFEWLSRALCCSGLDLGAKTVTQYICYIEPDPAIRGFVIGFALRSLKELAIARYIRQPRLLSLVPI